MQLIKENKSESDTYESKAEDMDSSINQLMATPAYKAPVPRMHIWSTSPTLLDTPSDSAPSGRWDKNDAYATPTMKRFVPNFPQDDSPGTQTPFRAFVTPFPILLFYFTNSYQAHLLRQSKLSCKLMRKATTANSKEFIGLVWIFLIRPQLK